MKQTVTKVGVLCFLGLGAVAYGQQTETYKGKVGINTEQPSATLDIQPNGANAQENATTNEGLIIPRLTKARVNNITTPVEGTQVYVTDAVTATDTKFEGTGKGFYFYNGTKWIKQPDYNDSSEWIYDANNKRINLKRSGQKTGFVNQIYYDSENGRSVTFTPDTERLFLNIEDVQNISSLPYDLTKFGGANIKMIESSTLEKDKFGPGDQTRVLINRENIKISPTEEADVLYNTSRGLFIGPDNAENYVAAYNTEFLSLLGGKGTISNAIGATAESIIGNSQSVEGYNAGVLGTSAVASTGNVGSAFGVYGRNFFYSTNGAKVKTAAAGNFYNGMPSVQDNSLIQNFYGIQVTSEQKSQNEGEGVELIGVSNKIIQAGKTSYENVIGSFNHISLENDAKVPKNIYGSYNNIILGKATKAAENMYGFYLYSRKIDENTPSPNNQYGIYISSIKDGADNNYSVYTNEGQIRLGDLQGTGDRVVYADANGVLKTGIANASQIATQDDMTCDPTNRGKMNFVPNDNGSDVFGICLRNKDGKYYWVYMVGGSNPTNGTGVFGSGFNK